MLESDEKTPDAIALLKADHRAVEELFDKYENASGQQKPELARSICKELIIHTDIEEEIFYPACREHFKKSGSLDEAQVEHDSAKALILELLSGSPDDPYYDAKVTVLAEQIKHHVREEEKRGEGVFAKAKAAGLPLEELGQKLKARKDELKAQDGNLRPSDLKSFSAVTPSPSSTQQESQMNRQGNYTPDRDERGRFVSDDDDRNERGRYSRMSSSSRGGGRYREDDDDRRSSRGRGESGWYGDPEGHSEASRRGWEGRGSSYRDDDDRHYSSRGTSGRYEDDDNGRSRSRNSDYDDDRRSSREHGGWYGDPEGHSEASRRGWEERGGYRSSSRSRYEDDDNGRYGSRSRNSDYDDDRRSSRGGHGGWFGDPEGHSEASRRGWRNRD